MISRPKMPKTAKLNSHEIIDRLKSQNLIAAKYSSFTVFNFVVLEQPAPTYHRLLMFANYFILCFCTIREIRELNRAQTFLVLQYLIKRINTAYHTLNLKHKIK